MNRKEGKNGWLGGWVSGWMDGGFVNKDACYQA